MIIKKIKDIIESSNYKDVVREIYDEYKELCFKICDFIILNNDFEISVVRYIWFDNNLLRVSYIDSLGNHKEYCILKDEYKKLLIYLKEQNIDNPKTICNKLESIYISISEFSMLYKIIDDEFFTYDIWYNDDKEFEVEYITANYDNYLYVFDEKEYNELLKFLENPEMYKNMIKYNL